MHINRTKGNWHISKALFWKSTQVIVNEDETIAIGQAMFAGSSDTFDRATEDEQKGNAVLMAAAPELLSALELYAIGYSDSDLEILANCTTEMGEISPDTARREIIRRKAITKATTLQ